MLKLYISHFTLLRFFKVLENFDVDLKKNIFMKAIAGQNVAFYILCSKLVVYLVMYFSQETRNKKLLYFINTYGGVQ